MRVTIASGIDPSAIAGRIRCLIVSQSASRIALQDRVEEVEVGRVRAVSARKSSRPTLGSQCSLTAKTYFRIRPRKKIGIEIPISDANRLALSNQLPYFLAAKKPSGRPTTIAKNIAASASSTVAGKRWPELVRDRPGRRDARPEVAVHGRVEVAPVLHVDRLVEAVLVADACDLLGRGVLAEQCFGRRARQGMNPAEDEDGQPEEDRDEQQQPADDEAKHLVSPPVVCSHLLARPTRSRPSRGPR